MRKLIKANKGFTLIELIVVIAILAILAAILIPSITNYIDQANRSKNQANARSAYSAAMLLETTAATPATANGKASTVDTACTYNVASGIITSFSCDYGTYTVSAPTFAIVND